MAIAGMEIVNAIIVLVTNKFPMVVLWGPLGGSDSIILLECLNICNPIKKCYILCTRHMGRLI